VNLSLAEYGAQLERIGICLIGQTRELAPSDRKLYALRDVTATVESIPLICGSILAKKLAEGIDVLVLDVKFGRGAFMKERRQARELAEALVSVAGRMGKPARAVLTAMEQPLGRAIGNALEVAEAIDCLRGNGPSDTMEVTEALGEQMLLLAGVAATVAEARARLRESVRSGAAWRKFAEMVGAQGGDLAVVHDPRRLPQARLQIPLAAARDGFVTEVDAMDVALAALRLGAGRARAEDPVDPAVGISRLVKIGEQVSQGAPLCVIHANDEAAAAEARAMLEKAIVLDGQPVAPPKLIDEIVG
jgi:pyrimidine-nucleoside phosphorylase